MATYGYTFQSGDGVTPARLNDARTVSDIVNADIKSDAAIALSKLATGALPSAITVASANLTYDNGPTGGFRNRIINGNFDIWQRGTGTPLNSGVGRFRFTSDRWRYSAGSTLGEGFVSRVAFTVGQTAVPNNPKYFGRFEHTVASDIASSISQPIEDASTFAGQQVTVSFWAKCASGTVSMTCKLEQFFGTGGSPSATVVTTAGTGTITTTWQQFAFATSLPSTSGKTLGTDGNDHVVFNIELPTTTYDVQIAQVQVEQGSKATPFEARPIGTELALCQRYYEKSTGGVQSRFQGYCVNGATYVGYTVCYKATKRAAPTLTLTNVDNFGFSSSVGTVTNSVDGFAEARVSSGTQNSGYFISSWEASAEL